jgi:hypothetical protein
MEDTFMVVTLWYFNTVFPYLWSFFDISKNVSEGLLYFHQNMMMSESSNSFVFCDSLDKLPLL